MAHSANLNSMWLELRDIFHQEKASGGEIPFDFRSLSRDFISTTGKLNDLINKPEPGALNEGRSSGVQFNLPKLQLPEFNGEPDAWKRFIALYDRMVDNNATIDDGMRMEYLKTCVEGNVARIINHIDPNPDSYTTCYDLPRKRFDNKREMVNALISNILKTPKMDRESAELMKSMHDTVYESIMSIKNIGISTENWDPFLCHILTGRLDTTTIINYECQLDDVRKPQTLLDFLG